MDTRRQGIRPGAPALARPPAQGGRARRRAHRGTAHIGEAHGMANTGTANTGMANTEWTSATGHGMQVLMRLNEP